MRFNRALRIEVITAVVDFRRSMKDMIWQGPLRTEPKLSRVIALQGLFEVLAGHVTTIRQTVDKPCPWPYAQRQGCVQS